MGMRRSGQKKGRGSSRQNLLTSRVPSCSSVTSDPHVVVVLPQLPAFLSEPVFKFGDPLLRPGDFAGDPGVPPEVAVDGQGTQHGQQQNPEDRQGPVDREPQAKN